MRTLLPILVVLAGCSAAPPAPEEMPRAPLSVEKKPASGPGARTPAVPREGAGDLVVAKMAGGEIRRSDIGDFVIRFYRDQANEALNHLVDERVIEVDVRAIGIELPAGRLEAAVEAEIAERERTVRVQFGARVDLATFLRDRHGVTLEEHRRDLHRLLRVRLLRDRLIRFHQIREDRVEARNAVFAEAEAAERAVEAVRAGADLSALAREAGLSGETVLPPFPEDELDPPELGVAVFALGEGEVSDPIAVTGGDGTRWHVFKVVRRMPARDVGWAETAGEVEAGLVERPLMRYEYLQWARQMREKYRIEVLR